MTKLEEQMKYLTFLKEVVKRDIKRKYYKSVLGVLWTVLNPLLSMLVMTLIFSTLFKRNIDNFPIYLLCGQIIFNFMNGSSRQSMNAILANAGYIRSIYIPKYIFVLSRVVEGFVDLLFSLTALVLVMLITHAKFTLNLLMLPTVLALVFIFTFGFSLILATYGTFFRDFQHLYGIFSMLWMWMSAIFYPKTIVPTSYRFLLDLNPAIHFIEIMRAICHQGVMPTEKSLIIASCYAVLMLLMGISVFKANENKFFLYV
ncbi:MAG: ABC transporter permease [Oscillospiraceae bacterium]|nr:ABC transporter permease [Oscillospiraceae bacterium]